MGKIKRKQKHKGYNPPLTLLDKFLYALYFILFVAIAISPFMIAIVIQKNLTFSDPRAIAFESTGSLWWTFPISLFLVISVVVLGICGIENKIPLFGNPKLRYGEPPFKKNIYPIFRRKQYVKESKSNKTPWYKGLIISWCVVFLVLSCLYPLGVCGRRVLFDDSTVTIYSGLNAEKITYSIEDFDHLTIRTYISISRYGSGRWVYHVEIQTTDGKNLSFKNKVSENAIDQFVSIKKLLDPEQITISGAHNLDKVIKDNKFNESEADKLTELFSTP